MTAVVQEQPEQPAPPPDPRARRAKAAAAIELELRAAREEERGLVNRLRRVRSEITDLQAGLIGLGIETED